jgi:ubiquinone/menaquinone biosynthesis C-methylase UbiE/DNA-binding transcriptional ArsR family regulator
MTLSRPHTDPTPEVANDFDAVPLTGLAVRRLEALRAAGEATRLRLLHLLAHDELSVMELVEILGQSQPRISRHLKLLADSGLIERFPEGAFVYYRLSHDRAAFRLTQEIIADLEDSFAPDLARLEVVRDQRRLAAQSYFEDIAPVWDQIRSHYISEADVEAAILKVLGDDAYERLVDLGTGSGRMLTLLAPKAKQSVGLDLSQRMLNIARVHVEAEGLKAIELRHGDLFHTRLPSLSADLVVIHQVLHFLGEPDIALKEAARILKPKARLLIVDFAPHDLKFMLDTYKHRRLGIEDAEMNDWSAQAGLVITQDVSLPPLDAQKGLNVRIWLLTRP